MIRTQTSFQRTHRILRQENPCSNYNAKSNLLGRTNLRDFSSTSTIEAFPQKL